MSERIVYDATTSVYDYQYFLYNIGTRPIDGFSVWVGNPFPLLGATALQVATRLGGGDPPRFPNVAGVGDNGVPFLTPGIGFGTTFESRWSNGAWGFEEYDNRAAANNAYLIRWYLPNQGGQPAINTREIARFDLYSPFGPVRGGGAVDPFSGGGFEIDDGAGDTAEFDFGSDPADTVPVCLDATDPGCMDVSSTDFNDPSFIPDILTDPTYADDFAGLTSADFSAVVVPEPMSIALMGTGLVLLAATSRRRKPAG